MITIDSLTNIGNSVRDGVGEALQRVIAVIPDVLAALVVLLIGVIVAAVLKSAVVRLLGAVKLGKVSQRLGVNRVFPGEYNVVELVGDLVKWFFIIVFLLQALTIVHLEQVNEVVSDLLGYVPNVLTAAVVVFVGFVVADLVARLVKDAARVVGSNAANILSEISKYSILVLVTFTALAQLGVNTVFLDRLFTAIVAMLALAGGLAFGLGGRDTAADVLASLRKSMQRDSAKR